MASHHTSFGLEGKVAIVTGASRGIGLALAKGLADAGADIVGVATSAMEETERAVLSLGRQFYGLTQDIGSSEAADVIVDAASERFGHVNILINNAGIIRRSAAVGLSEKDWDDVLNINLRAAFLLCQAFARKIKAQRTGGKIVNMAHCCHFKAASTWRPIVPRRAA